MDFTNSFTVTVPLERVWEFMLDAERVTPCVAGAAITEVIDPTHYKGTVKMKLGAVQMTYRGDLEMEPDEAARVIILRAKGTDVRGGGGATGTVTTRLTSDGGETTVQMESHVDVTGRVAQFGRGIMQDVANRLVKDFAKCIEAQLLAGEQPEETVSAAISSPPEPEPPASPLPAPAEERAPVSTPASSAPTPAPSAPPAPAPRAAQPPPPARERPAQRAGPPTAPAEIRPMDLLVAVLRSRLAALLRFLADRIEPK